LHGIPALVGAVIADGTVLAREGACKALLCDDGGVCRRAALGMQALARLKRARLGLRGREDWGVEENLGC
jgi:hypothetical protein